MKNNQAKVNDKMRHDNSSYYVKIEKLRIFLWSPVTDFSEIWKLFKE